MTLSDLLDKKNKGIFYDDAVLKCGLIALDSKNGKILFDTHKNKEEYYEKYKSGEVISLWSDVRLIKGIGYGDSFKPVMKCYVLHDSWEKVKE